MTFVPYVPPAPPSPRATELGRQLTEVIESYRRQHPDTSAVEARQALRLAGCQIGGKRRALVRVILGVLVGLGAVVALAARAGKSMPIRPVALILVVGAAVVAIGLLKALTNR